MMPSNLDASLYVWLKGADLWASTARLTLIGKMGYAGRLLGVRRFHTFSFTLAPAGASEELPGVCARVRRALDRQSTFYNRNKHTSALAFKWPGGEWSDGPSPAGLEASWLDSTLQSIGIKANRDLDGNVGAKRDILEELKSFLVEVRVEALDTEARQLVAAKLEASLGDVCVECQQYATLWWLALAAPDASGAQALAHEIAVTTRRDRGLLLNPHFERADVGSPRHIGREQA